MFLDFLFWIRIAFFIAHAAECLSEFCENSRRRNFIFISMILGWDFVFIDAVDRSSRGRAVLSVERQLALLKDRSDPHRHDAMYIKRDELGLNLTDALHTSFPQTRK